MFDLQGTPVDDQLRLAPAKAGLRRAPHPFWRFSLGFYRRRGVERACLGLQNACGADVNMLLFCCWMGAQGRPLDRRSLRRAVTRVRSWQEQVVQPLRRARRALKRSSAALPEAWRTELRRNVFRLELDGEYVEQLMLARLAAGIPRPARTPDPEATVAANLERYLGLLGTALAGQTKRRSGILRRAIRTLR